MDKKQKVIVALLVVAIVFSVASVVISLSLSDVPRGFKVVSTSEPPVASIGLVVEDSLNIDSVEGSDGN